MVAGPSLNKIMNELLKSVPNRKSYFEYAHALFFIAHACIYTIYSVYTCTNTYTACYMLKITFEFNCMKHYSSVCHIIQISHIIQAIGQGGGG